MLTERQAEAFRLIEASIRDRGVAPTYKELMSGLGLKSASRAVTIIDVLVEKGYIRRIHYRARAIEVIRGHYADGLRGALERMIYEATHLSKEADDGSHWCRITREALDGARAALIAGADMKATKEGTA